MAKAGVNRTSHRAYRRNREIVLAASDICHLCGFGGADSVDHVVPFSKGGTDEVLNLKACHLDCNRIRGNKDISTLDIRRPGGVVW